MRVAWLLAKTIWRATLFGLLSLVASALRSLSLRLLVNDYNRQMKQKTKTELDKLR